MHFRVMGFMFLTILLLWLTLRRPYRHRFPRFFAFDALLGLVFLNAPWWFIEFKSSSQLASWGLLMGSFLLALHGFWMLKTRGAPDEDIENTTHLVQEGAYRWIRHPLYTSLFLLGLGVVLKHVSWESVVLFCILLLALFWTAKFEEQDNVQRFGRPYQEYMRRTRRFIPYLY